MKFKVGDKVVIIKANSAINFENKIATITRAVGDWYRIDLDGGLYSWSGNQFEPCKEKEMTAREFLEGRKRMCSYYKDCTGCPLKQDEMLCGDFMYKNTKEAIEAINNWCKKHPIVTISNKFFEVFPNAKTQSNGMPTICPDVLGYENAKSDGIGCSEEKCKKCWSQEYVKQK